MNFLLDTNAIIHLSRRKAEHHQNIKAKLLSKALQFDVNICISMVSLYELEYGVAHTDDEQIIFESRRIIESIKKDKEITIFSLTENAAKIFGEIKEQYRKQKGIGKKALQKHNADLMIASTLT